MTVIALKPLTHRGRRITEGEVFDVKPIEALAYSYQKLVKFAKSVPLYRTAAMQPEAFAEPSVSDEKPKRRYRRRDMQAEGE